MNISKINNCNSLPNFKGLGAAGLLAKASGINSWQQRAILGATAITLQPIIDLKNKEVDEETRKISANRSFAKGLVGAATGIVVRGGCMKVVEQCLKKDSWADKLAKITAEDKTTEALEKAKDFIKNQNGGKKYAAVIGTMVALGVMLFTNFLVDAPITNWLTDKMNEKYQGEKPSNAPVKNGGQ